ncbi:MAG: glycerophosphodiester phosphodiesterase family protein [Bacteroidota bacterium]
MQRLRLGFFFIMVCGLVLETGCGKNTVDMDIQGHRGCRGLMPENSIPGFLKALEMGVNTLEMDVVISADREVIVSHEAWMSHAFCLDSLGREIAASEERNYNLFHMTYAEIERFDCGSKVYALFPKQAKMRVAKPRLQAVFQAAEQQARAAESPHLPQYNIELKRQPGGEGVYQPELPEFVKLVLRVLDAEGVAERTTLQAFDIATLREVQRQSPEITLALLVGEDESYPEKLVELGFNPAILSPASTLVDIEMMGFARSRQMQVIPWTVNEPKEMDRLIALGVSGIITDYPDQLIKKMSDY